jgi:hypothetical protein
MWIFMVITKEELSSQGEPASAGVISTRHPHNKGEM